MPRVVRVSTTEGCFTAVMGEPGRIYTPYVCLEGKVVSRHRMPNGDVARYATDLMKGTKPYPLKRAINHMLRVGRTRGITKGAKTLLREAKAQ